MREAFREALVEKGFDRSGRRDGNGKGKDMGLRGTLEIYVYPGIVEAEFGLLKKQVGLAVEALLKEHYRYRQRWEEIDRRPLELGNPPIFTSQRYPEYG